MKPKVCLPQCPDLQERAARADLPPSLVHASWASRGGGVQALALLLLLWTPPQSCRREKEHHPAPRMARKLRQDDAWEKLKSCHQRSQVLGKQIAPHLTETDYSHLLPETQGPLTGSQALPTSVAQSPATSRRPAGCSWLPREEMGSPPICLTQLPSDPFDTLEPIQDLLCWQEDMVCTDFTF